MKVGIVSLFPEYFDAPFGCSILGRARTAGVWEHRSVSPRDYATNRHNTVDDTPYGGGAGMVMRATELAAAVDATRAWAGAEAPVVLLSPQGRPFTQEVARTLARLPSLVLVCGRYEGVDERFVQRRVDWEVSVGDFVLTGGEAAAICVVDAVVRLIPGALGNQASATDESFSGDRLEYPQYTRPPVFEGLTVPEVLTSGNHAHVAAWRRRAGLLRTAARRPDLLVARPPDEEESRLLADGRHDVEPELVVRRDPLQPPLRRRRRTR